MANPLDDLRIKVRARLLPPPACIRCTARPEGAQHDRTFCTAAWQAIRPLVPSACLIEDAPADAEVYDTVSTTRTALSKAVRGEDDRIVVIVGPTAVHECKATMEFAVKLSAMAESLKADLIVVMRVGMAPHGDWAGMVSWHSLPLATCCEPPVIITPPPPRRFSTPTSTAASRSTRACCRRGSYWQLRPLCCRPLRVSTPSLLPASTRLDTLPIC